MKYSGIKLRFTLITHKGFFFTHHNRSVDFNEDCHTRICYYCL